jgi:hypothetical protein
MNPMIAMLLTDHDHEDYPYPSQFYVDNYLKNTLGYRNKNFTKFGHVRKSGSVVDIHTEYKTNNFGFRDEDWTSSANILAAGCSNTYGLGVPVNGAWPTILKSLTNKSVHNISRPGMSIQELIFQIFAYFKTFGNPETLVCLFPDPFRMQIPTKKNLSNVGGVNKDDEISDIHLNHKTNTKISDRQKYLKIPYDYRETLPMEVPLFFSMKLIHMLEQYCNSNNIKFVWSSWDINFRNVCDNVDSPFSNYYSNQEFTMRSIPEAVCHAEYKDLFLKYFDIGQDIEDGTQFAHPGVHRHIHIAESFYKKLNQ